MTKLLLWLPALTITILPVASAQVAQRSHEGPVLQRLVSFEDMDYPPAARIVKQQGIVVVDIRLDDKGFPTSVSALTGADLLVPSATENAKRWRFEPNAQGRAIVVYDFSIDLGVCHDRKRSLFLLRRSNFAQVLACDPVIDTQR